MTAVETLGACPLCANTNIRHLDESFHFDQCQGCGFVFDNPRPTLDTIALHYSKTSNYDGWVQQSAARDELWRRRLKKVLRDAAPGSLLDVGAGIGQFLALAKPHFASVAGTELSEIAVKIASERYGLHLDCGTVEDLDLSPTDNITLFHVLEHVPSPPETLRRCFELLRSGGRIFLCVPNDIHSWTSRLRAMKSRLRKNGNSQVVGLPRWESTPEIHLSHFTRSTLRFALEQAGFKVRREDFDPYFVASGWRLFANNLNYHVHSALHLPSYQALWFVGEKPRA